jgi:hypothetical protein
VAAMSGTRASGRLRRGIEGYLLFPTLVGICGAGGHLLIASQQSPPVLRTGVDVVTIDVQVTSKQGATVRELTAADFSIKISGRTRDATSVAFLHYDEGTVTRDSAAQGAGAASPECVFGFHRTQDRRTAHYLIGVARTDADTKAVKEVRVSIADKTVVVQRHVWRSPIRRSASR